MQHRVLIIIPGAPAFGRFVGLIDAIGAHIPGATFTYAFAPEGEALDLLAAGRAEMIVPYPKAPLDGVPFFLSTAPVTKAYYVLYTNTSKRLDVARLAHYAIEGEARNAAVLGVALRASGGAAESIAKVSRGLIDGYISPEGAADPALRKLGFKNVHRRLYLKTDKYVLLPDTRAGQHFDRLLTAAIPHAVGTPGYDRMQERPYGEWQP